MVQVIFSHDEQLKKWETHVTGAKDELEARQAFYAVALTVQMLEVDLLDKAIVTKCPMANNAYRIEPAASPNSPAIRNSGQVINEIHAFMPAANKNFCRLCGRGRDSRFHQL